MQITKGFTLVEVMVSVMIMAILSSGIASLIGNSSRQYTRDSRRKSDLETIRSALEIYRSDKGFYPTDGASGAYSDTTSCADCFMPNYIRELPVDPQNPAVNYQYVTDPVGCTNLPAGTYCNGFRLCSTVMEKSTPPFCLYNP